MQKFENLNKLFFKLAAASAGSLALVLGTLTVYQSTPHDSGIPSLGAAIEATPETPLGDESIETTGDLESVDRTQTQADQASPE